MPNESIPPVDSPIESSAKDALERADVAREFAATLRELDASGGLVIGVLGAWGHGKTSFINMMKEEFAAAPELPVIEFNPWLFSGSMQITDVFFREVAAELRIEDESKFSKIADGLNTYGDVLSPLAIIPGFGGWFDRAFKAGRLATNWWAERKKGSRTVRDQVTEGLKSLDQPVVIVIDDIDRLTTHEIRDIFKLVRLTASFPNVIYVLAFDRRRVEEALTESGVSGRAYLEKIVQLSFDLPGIPREVLRSQVFERLNSILDGIERVRFTEEAWPAVYFEVIEPLIGNLRDVTRLAMSAHVTLRALGDETETVDLMALEAIRVFRPELFAQIQKHRIVLTESRDTFSNTESTRQQAAIEEMIETAGDEADVVKNLINHVFPTASRYIGGMNYGHDFSVRAKRDHRVAHIDYLNHYLERTAPSGLVAFRRSEQAFAKMSEPEEFATFWEDVSPEDLEDAITGLEAYEREFPIEGVPAASIVLLNLIHVIPERPSRGMFDFMEPEVVVARVVLRMLRRIDSEADRESAIAEIMPSLTSFSTQLELLTMIGYREGAGHKLVNEEMARQFELQFVERVSGNHSPVPGEEYDLARVMYRVAEAEGDSYVPPVLTEPEEIRSLLTSARSIARSQSMGAYTVREQPHLWWDGLIRILGDEQSLRAAIATLREADGETPLLDLADKYLEGWRPRRD
ncbi:P-loop NTPase fold protein [Frigoribacterium sp. MCBA15_019]|uniref:KAP family P-loop NTPase fold protein n=1 Tax=Frigoribacterium sp. MCBA15_019 TaxID=1898745 RepID=UPI0008DE436D|nr:P-loop NTPase fold protein [Frigoribacterium sp. MCBA15_019]OII23898.1 hypothetical protein BIV04_07540 [Frigoribacterium sp. MCBA15_019]